MLKQQLPHGVIELRHGEHAQHAMEWLVVRQTVQPHSKRLDVQVEETELAMAFELGRQAPSQRQVFAFLPLRRYGLRFIVQVASSSALTCFFVLLLCLPSASASQQETALHSMYLLKRRLLVASFPEC